MRTLRNARYACAGAAFVAMGLCTAPALAQQTTTNAQPKAGSKAVTVSSLTQIGFDVAAVQKVNKTFLLTLQRGARVFICEVEINGKTKLCIEVK